MSIATRMAVWSVLSILMALLWLGGSLVWAVGNHLAEGAVATAQSVAQETAILASSPGGAHGQQLSLNDPGMVAAADGRNHLFIQIDAGTQVVQRSSNLKSTTLPESAPPKTPLRWGDLPLWGISFPMVRVFGSPAVLGYAPITQQGKTIGTVIAAVSLQPTISTVDTVGRGLIRVGATILIVVGVTTGLLIYRASRRIRRLTRTIVRINSGNDLQRRVELKGPADEIQALAQAFNRMLDRLEESFRRQELIVAQASHQLRTPLASALGYADMLSRWAKDQPDLLDEGLYVIQSQLARLNHTVDAILRMAAVEGMGDLSLQSVDISKFFYDWARQAGDDVVVAEGPNVSLVTDPVLLAQLFDIFLANTRQHAKDCAPALIRWDLDGRGQTLSIDFMDSGPGFDADLLPLLFRPFVKHAESPGTGLGLALAQAIVHRLGGTVSAANRRPRGASITVRLPVTKM